MERPTTLKFQLLNSQIYKFKYKGGSLLIDNLEPDPNTPIIVLENFKLKDFKFCYQNYSKYLKFSSYCFDILHKSYFWNLNQLSKVSNLILDTPLSNWLMFDLNTEIISISKNIFNKSFDLKNIHLSNITPEDIQNSTYKLYYYFDPKPIHEKIILSCINNQLDITQWLLSFNEIDLTLKIPYTINHQTLHLSIFELSSIYSKTEILDWLLSLSIFQINEKLISLVCTYSNLETFQWIHSKFTMDFKEPLGFDLNYLNIMDFSASKGNLPICQWIHSQQPFTNYELNFTFIHSIQGQNLDLVEWIYSQGADLRKYYFHSSQRFIDKAFFESCIHNNLSIMQFIHSIDPYDISKTNYYILTQMFSISININLDMAQWIASTFNLLKQPSFYHFLQINISSWNRSNLLTVLAELDFDFDLEYLTYIQNPILDFNPQTYYPINTTNINPFEERVNIDDY